MDNMRYMCFCRSFFSNVDTFISHVTCCPQIKNSNTLNAQSEKMIIDKLSEYSKINEDLKSDFKLKLMKSWAIVVDEDESTIKSDNTTPKLWGRRLPKRTKVPYLSRAVPLSTDHSYERCQCGAVFVTRMGKRQHQASESCSYTIFLFNSLKVYNNIHIVI
ncbi:hypothetical protein Phum_PHUM239900 [Pediculus humanus corporis]|uniref:Uncharacterized protein n=1 Tax=Pediculus humanus subsp. corporis TaxID=121224 RepID=E0VJ80_PEDHC|nr:uncharacterized protein Phum_PHUM239900 [Pediculus humanus corporis]EEB13436.1 hypothetical protein Phum_PHUM239900 [Pediculus humanus corporis]